MSEELKPCPFCGGPAKHNNGGNSAYGRLWWSAWCEECRIELCDREKWTADFKLDPIYPPKECFERWNSRSDAAKDAEITRLREALEYVAENDIAYLKAPGSPPPKGYPGHLAGVARSALKPSGASHA